MTKTMTAAPQQSRSLQLAKERQSNLKSLLLRATPALKDVLPKYLTPERMVRVALLAANRDPKLLECTPESILGAMMQSAQFGLEVGGVAGHAYLVPYWNTKKGRREAQFIVGYRGLLALVWRAAQIDIDADVVHRHDYYECEKGLHPRLAFRRGAGDRGEPIGAWALARLPDGRARFDEMTTEEINAVRDKTRRPGEPVTGPWLDYWGEMAKKTVVRRLVKYLPIQSDEVARALDAEDRPAGEETRTSAPELLVELPAGGDDDEPPTTEHAPASRQVEAIRERGRRATLAAPGGPPPPLSPEEIAEREREEPEVEP